MFNERNILKYDEACNTCLLTFLVEHLKPLSLSYMRLKVTACRKNCFALPISLASRLRSSPSKSGM
ncbi:hypothetical protein BpHYR1_051384 [Brachionus plicatilis]|uniref:Uncharacterized protein n=1 Tax=Brachionus plicatilis TaxID=10195 RepID=A0A3M7PRC4_BRAPC|nr:hypothetical protein BpHYR1_051384 [Brachionus plicatilis]